MGVIAVALEIRYLGPWEVLADGEPIPVAGRRRIGVLARLALDAGQTVPAERILADVWGNSSAVTAAKQLHIVISKLRELQASYGVADIIATVPGGYRLAVERDYVDAHLFSRLAKRARSARALGAADTADALFRRALGLWRGAPLGEVGASWARVEATRLGEARLAVLEDHGELRLAAGDHQAIATEFVAHVKTHPLRERLAAQLMLALHRSSRSPDALAVYLDIRRAMVEELGVEPSAELRRLHKAVLVGDPVLDLSTPQQKIAVGTPYVPAELPTGAHAFTARETEVDELRAALGPDARPTITVIDGSGGVGKSALAIHVAHAMSSRFTDGVVYINLHGSTAGLTPLAPMEALRHLLRSLGLDGSAVPADPDEAAARYRSLTATCNLLVILDNARSISQVRPLIPAGPNCRVLVTSRDPLATLDSAAQLHLGALTDADADALLTRLAGTSRVRAEPEAAEEIVRLCGGIPLGLRIVAARLAARPDWTLRDLAARLADTTRRLDTLAYGDLAVRATIAVSHQHLGEEPTGKDAASLLTLLGLLNLPTYTSAATAALADWPEHRADAALERLLDARLLESAGPGRYQFHDLIGLYAHERARQDLPEDDRTEATRRVLHHYLVTIWMASTLLSSENIPRCPVEFADSIFTDRAEVGRWVEDERDNLLTLAQHGLEGADDQAVVDLVIGLHQPFSHKAWHTQLADIYERTIEMADRLDAHESKAALRGYLGWVYRDQGRNYAAIPHLQLALIDCDRASLPKRKVAALNQLGVINTLMGRLDDALGYLEAALALNDENERPLATAALRNNRVCVYSRQGRVDEAVEEAQAVVELWSKLDPHVGAATAHESLADAYKRAGRLSEAVESYRMSAQLMCRSEYRLGEAVSRWRLGIALHGLDRHDEAREQQAESIRLLRDANLLTSGEATGILAQDAPETPQPIKNML